MASRSERRREREQAGSDRERGAEPVRIDARERWVALGLALLVLVAFAPAASQQVFWVVDDAGYVAENPMVASGLGVDGIAWAFGLHGAMGNWHPLTWLSHMSDVSLFGLEPSAHKAVNVALHAGATVLAFLALRTLTGQLWPSAFAAALFGVHPLRVESVVWISERKDVLSVVFWMAALLAWARHARDPDRHRAWPVWLAFALGLASKAMVVTFPVVLLLLDVWPLARHRTRSFAARVREKAPLLALSLAAGVLAVIAQSRGAAIAPLERYGLVQRVANALASIGSYLASFVLPLDLAPYYPHRYPTPAQIDELHDWIPALVSLAVIAALSLGAFAARRRAPAFALGWLWFGITIAPVIGLLQVGQQGMADRYTYLPSLGLAIALAFPLWELTSASPRRRRGVAIAAFAAIAGLVPWTFATVRAWRSNVELCRRALVVTDARGLPHDGFMERMLAASHLVAARQAGAARLDSAAAAEAMHAAEEALRLRPKDPEAHSTYGDVLIETGRFADALAANDAYLAVAREAGRSDFVAVAWYARGLAHARLLQYDQARFAFEKALETEPGFGLAAESLAWAREAAASARAPREPAP